jgi:hypothetical protein
LIGAWGGCRRLRGQLNLGRGMHGGARQRQPLLTRAGVKLSCRRYAAKPPECDDGGLASGIVAVFFAAVSFATVFVTVVFVVTVLFVVMVVVALVTAARGVVPAFACHTNLRCQPQSDPPSAKPP